MGRAPKIHAELQKLGFTMAERTVARYLRRIVRRGDPDQKWLTFCRTIVRSWPLATSSPCPL
jgi:hypothetical protein